MENTFSPTNNSSNAKWYCIDAKDKSLGRLSSQISQVLTNKYKPDYSFNFNNGDYLIIINSKTVKLNKPEQKFIVRYSGNIGGITKKSFLNVINENPNAVIKKAVKGMLPKGSLGRDYARKLKIYPAEEHPHAAQKPILLN
mgnify:CR=1 FL=1|jgi:large subunit ribosomal protein L13